MLYLGTGDGGGQGDASEGHSPGGNAQDLAKLNGKVLRLDVDGKRPYAIPKDNPKIDGARPEIYAYGFRNPWRLTWEPGGARRLLVSDVGYGRYEEIDVVNGGGELRLADPRGHALPRCRSAADRDGRLPDDRGRRRAARRSGPRVRAQGRRRGRRRRVRLSRLGHRGPARPATSSPTSAPTRTTTCRSRAGRCWSRRPSTGRARGTGGRLVLSDGSLSRFVTGMGEDAAGELYVLTRTRLGPVGTSGEVLKLVPPGG